MKRFVLQAVHLILLAFAAEAYQISVGTYVANAGKVVTVPVVLDSAAGLSYAGATLAYDPRVLVVTKAEAGSLKSLMAEDFTAVDTNGTLTVSIFGSADANVAAGSGSIANVTFAVRDGTEGLYSDIAVTDIQLGERTGVKDVAANNPITTVNGMIRVVGAGAAVTRLDSPQTVCSGTLLASLTLKDGDAILADAAQSNPVRVSGPVVNESAAIRVKAPLYGWSSGTYTLLSTPTAGLAFDLEGTTASYSSETVNGITTYYAVVKIAGEPQIVCDSEALDADVKAQIREYTRQAIAKLDLSNPENARLKEAFETGTLIKVSGPNDTSVSLISDMGLAPALSVDEAGTLNLAYARPTLSITSFNPQTGAVGIKVVPGQGNSIIANINTGYVHVYGTSVLGERMKYISNVGFDMTPYLKEATKGEGTLYVTLGSHTFLKVKLEVEPKTEGQVE